MGNITRRDFYIGVVIIALAIFFSGGFYESTLSEEHQVIIRTNTLTGDIQSCRDRGNDDPCISFYD